MLQDGLLRPGLARRIYNTNGNATTKLRITLLTVPPGNNSGPGNNTALTLLAALPVDLQALAVITHFAEVDAIGSTGSRTLPMLRPHAVGGSRTRTPIRLSLKYDEDAMKEFVG